MRKLTLSLLLALALAGCGQPSLDEVAANAASLVPNLDKSDSLAGPDANKNGIRDDIDNFLKGEKIEPKALQGIEYIAKFMQMAVTVDAKDKYSVRMLREANDMMRTCTGVSFIKARNQAEDSSIQLIRSITANTKNRIENYIEFQQAVKDIPFDPEKYKGSCPK